MPAEHPLSIEVRGTTEDIVQNAETLRAQLEDLISGLAEDQAAHIAKAQPTIKPHPVLPVEQLKRDLLDAYEASMVAMNHELGQVLDRIAEGDELADLDDHVADPSAQPA